MLAVAVGSITAFAELRTQRDVVRRLTAAHNTPFPHLAALLLDLTVHLGELARGRDARRHGEAAFVAFLSLLILAVPPILTAEVAEISPLAQHGVPFALGTIAWSVVVEVPGQLSRLPHLALTTSPLAMLAVILIVLALDMTVTVLAVSGVIQGAQARAFGCGLAVFAVAHVVSAVLSLVHVAFDPDSR